MTAEQPHAGFADFGFVWALEYASKYYLQTQLNNVSQGLFGRQLLSAYHAGRRTA
jgi:hypothetical protein